MPPDTWRLITPGTTTVPQALALPLDLLVQGDGPAIVVHRVDPPAITCGRAQMRTVDPASPAAQTLNLYARASGGGPVLWDQHLIAIDIVLPTGHRLLPTDVVAAYRWVGQAVADALAHLRIEGARAVPPDEARAWPTGASAGLCFGGLSPWEVVVGTRKALGLSQVRRQAGAVIQVGVPMRLDAQRLALAVSAPPGAADDLTARTAGIADLLPGADHQRVTQALLDAFARASGMDLAPTG